jgi:hypothetical protein
VSRVRTGHGPQDWSAPDDGVPARVVGANFGGELVVAYTPPPAPRVRTTVDMNDYAPGTRWASRPRCGVVMRLANVPCVRMAGHKREHASEEAMEYRRQCRRQVA